MPRRSRSDPLTRRESRREFSSDNGTARGNPRHLRALLCEEAARVVADEGVRDYQQAKRKASVRLGIDQACILPSNSEIAEAIRTRLSLFDGQSVRFRCRQRLWSGLLHMELLGDFYPTMVGTILDGYMPEQEPVEIHVVAPTPEDILLLLHSRDIRYREFDKRFRFGRDVYRWIPGVRFTADGADFEICIFPDRNAFDVPRCPIRGGPMRRASRERVRELLNHRADSPA